MESNNTEATEQPATESDSKADGLQEGGLTPAVVDAIASLPADQQATVKEQISGQNAYITKTRQSLDQQKRHLQRDVQMAGVMKELLKDSEFSEYLQARESGSLPTFYRGKAGIAAGNNTTIPESNLESSGLESPLEDSSVPADVNSGLEMRLASIEQNQAQVIAQAQIDEFSAKHDDYEEFLPLMYSARSRLPNASLEDLYHVAKGTAALVAEPGAQPGVEVGQEQQKTTISESEIATPVSPPPPVGAASSTSPAGTPATSISEAFAKAKEQLGIDGPVFFQQS